MNTLTIQRSILKSLCENVPLQSLPSGDVDFFYDVTRNSLSNEITGLFGNILSAWNVDKPFIQEFLTSNRQYSSRISPNKVFFDFIDACSEVSAKLSNELYFELVCYLVYQYAGNYFLVEFTDDIETNGLAEGQYVFSVLNDDLSVFLVEDINDIDVPYRDIIVCKENRWID